MERLSRKCTRCGSFDTRESWTSLDEATKAGVFKNAWTCSTCAWTDFDLVEPETETVEEPASRR